MCAQRERKIYTRGLAEGVEKDPVFVHPLAILVIKKCRSLSPKNVRTAAMGWMITNTTHTNTQPSLPRPMATANTGRQSPGPSWCSIVSRLTDHLQASYPDSPTSRNSTRRSPNAMISPVKMQVLPYCHSRMCQITRGIKQMKLSFYLASRIPMYIGISQSGAQAGAGT